MTSTDDHTTITLTVPAQTGGTRLDRVLAGALPQFSRTQIQQWIRGGRVSLAGVPALPRSLVYGGEEVEVLTATRDPGPWAPEAIPLQVIYEDTELAVIDKPAGLVVHPGAGVAGGTLVNAILARWPDAANLPRAGLIHRLDKETSGLLVVARQEATRLELSEALREHAIHRTYRALVYGHLIAGGLVDAPIGRHTHERTRMAVRSTGRPSVTHYHVERRFGAVTELKLELESGRTHQIRVHMMHIGHPLVGDPVYRGRGVAGLVMSPARRLLLGAFPRQALHAEALTIPRVDGRVLTFTSPLPDDFASLLGALAAESAS